MKLCFPIVAAIVLMPAFLSPALAQLPVTAQIGSTQYAVSDGSSIPMTSDAVGHDVIGVFTLRNPYSTAIAVAQISASGSDFSLAAPTLPASIPPGGSLQFTVRYLPTSAARTASSAQVIISYATSGIGQTLSFTLSGSAPVLSLNYFVQPDGAVASLSAGGKIAFGTANLQSTKTAVIVINNMGTVAATVTSAAVTGADFQILGGALAAQTVAPGQELRFSVNFTPQQRGTSLGTLSLIFGSSAMSVSLEGIGATPSLVLSYLSEGNANSLANGDTIAFPNTAVKTTSSITVSVSNQGTGQGTIKGILVTGPGFLATGLPAFPASIDPGKELRFTLQFAPKDVGTATGGLRIDLSDRSVSAKLQGSTADPTFAVYYALADANTRTLTDGSRLTFTPTTVNTSTTATVAIANNGAGPGDLVAVALTGAGFELQGLPAFPFSIEPTKALTLRLVFTPKQQQDYAGTLRIDFRDRSLTINVEGSAQSAVYTYESGNDQGTQPLAVGGAIAFRDAAVGQTSRAIVRIRNAGNAAGQLTTIAISGQDFQFIDAVALPLTLQPNETRQFTLGFTPSQPSSIRGQLRIGADVFDLTGTGLGSRLTYTTSAGTATTTVAESGAVIFTPARIGESSAVAFSIQNTGTADASIASINLTAPTAVYSLEDLPPMPFSLAPGATANLTIRFLPNNSGTLNATLRVNNASFTLSGAGLPPSALPDYSFQGPAGAQQPLQQPTVGLTLTAPYPLGLRGTLTLSFISDEYNANPAVQFATGGRTVAFTIPPNSTQAVFDGGKTAIGLQTGTVAGAINVTPTFATVAGYDLTPANAPALNMNISRSAPKLLDASLTSRTSTGFAITVTGFATGRSLKQLEFQLIPKSGERITNATVTVNVEGSALLWFQSAASQSFGGMFTITVPFALQGAANQDLAGKVQSVSVTASNDLGASSPATVDVSR